MSCIYGDVFSKIFSEVSTYGKKNPSKIEDGISDIFGSLSEKFNSETSVEDHLGMVVGLGAMALALNEVGVPTELALAPYSIAVIDAAKHGYDSIPQDNPYAGNGISPANP